MGPEVLAHLRLRRPGKSSGRSKTKEIADADAEHFSIFIDQVYSDALCGLLAS